MKPDAPITTKPVIDSRHALDESVPDQIGDLIGIRRGASNEWVVAGSRTVTGKPILANDPHLELGAPILWYLARIVTPEGSLRGATVPGGPIVLLGQNDNIAWGFTTADTDVQDLFIETIDPSDPSKYLTPDGPKAFDTREETIHVKDAADVKLTVRTTRHGPVLSDVSADLASIAEPGKAVALAFTGLGDHDTTAEAMMRLNAARNWGEFLDALKLYQTPDAEYRLCRCLRRHRLLQSRPRSLAQVRRRTDASRRRVRRLRLDRRDPVRSAAPTAQPGNRLRFQRQQRQRPDRRRVEIRARLGGGFPRAPHSRVLRHDRQAQSRRPPPQCRPTICRSRPRTFNPSLRG